MEKKRAARLDPGKPKAKSPPSPSPGSFPRVSFIVCHHRKSKPKVSPAVCEKRCERTKDCREYFNYIQPAMFGRYEKREAKKREPNSERSEQGAKVKTEKGKPPTEGKDQRAKIETR